MSCTCFVSVEQDGLGFEDENYVLGVGSLHQPRLAAQEFIRLVHLLKDFLERESKTGEVHQYQSSTLKGTDNRSNTTQTNFEVSKAYPSFRVFIRMVYLGQFEVSFSYLGFFMPKNKFPIKSIFLLGFELFKTC